MLSIKNIVSCLILLNVFAQIKTLVELPVVEDNHITAAEAAIRQTMNKIFATFRIQDVKHRPRLKQYTTIHNFFVSITLTDCNNLNEIQRLTRVNSIDNSTQYFITQINEVLNEDDKSYEANDVNNVYVTKYISMFIRKLKYLKEMYATSRNTDINANVLRYLDDREKSLTNVTETNNVSDANDTDEITLDDSDFWQPSGRRIYQGIRTTIKNFPFMASVLFFKKFQCAGSILKDDLVITSASCLQLAWNNRFFRENPAFLSVQVGSDVYEGGGENIAVIEIYFYPQYDPKTLRNNLALMRLTRKIIFKNRHKRVKKIDFDRNPAPMPINSPRITVIGWGAKDSSNVISDVAKNRLSYAQLDYYSLRDCQEHYSEDFVTQKNFCAGFISKGGGACNRDAGGPGVVENILFGVISFGSPICGAPDAPTVFTKLGYYYEWIESIMEQAVPSVKQMTTKLVRNTLFLLDFRTDTVSTLKFQPLTDFTTHRSVPITEVDQLRIAQDQGFKDFLETMFSKDDVKEYFDNQNFDEDINDGGTNEDIDEKHAKAISEILLHKTKLKGTKSQLKHTTIPTTSYSKPDDSSDEDKSDKDHLVITTTEPQRKVTVLENVSDGDKNLEADIMTLIDNLDIDKILKPVLADKTHQQKIITNSNENAKKKVYVKEASSGSEENLLQISPKQQSVLNFLFLSEENRKDENYEEEGGLSIQADNFRDLTFRDRPNNTKKHDVLSETALYDLISLAIDEEAKRLRKQKRYSL